jgi:leucyl/phenylalanyl-tRNA---protein transferase
MFLRLPRLPWPLLTADPEAWPALERTRADGIVAIGGDLKPARLLAAYRRGIFPWYSEGQPILWHSPDPRFVLQPEALHVPRSLARLLRKAPYRLTLDTAFDQVIDACAQTDRPGQNGTWITRDMRAAYLNLHREGWAHSAEAWREGQLVGGLYGVAIGGVFYGESMFALAPDASKAAFVTLVQQLRRWGFGLIDCQQETNHLERFGATLWPRARFTAELSRLVTQPGRPGPWRFDEE